LQRAKSLVALSLSFALAGTLLGIMAVVKPPADGYTLLYATTNIATNPGVCANLPKDHSHVTI